MLRLEITSIEHCATFTMLKYWLNNFLSLKDRIYEFGIWIDWRNGLLTVWQTDKLTLVRDGRIDWLFGSSFVQISRCLKYDRFKVKSKESKPDVSKFLSFYPVYLLSVAREHPRSCISAYITILEAISSLIDLFVQLFIIQLRFIVTFDKREIR